MSASPALIFSLLVTVAFTLTTWLEPRAQRWTEGRGSDHLLQILLGDGRKILAERMFTEADIYFHSGYYPSMFDQQYAPTNAQHMTQPAAEHHGPAHESDTGEGRDEAGHEKAMRFLHEPRDWIERFGRNFFITQHTHLAAGKEREILPWLRLSADLDSHRIETYTVAAFWLRRELGKPAEAEQFLREGLQANPGSCEILLELGRLYYENYHDAKRARNVWELAVQRWNEREGKKDRPEFYGLTEITVLLAHLEEDQGNYAKAIDWLEQAKRGSPTPKALQTRIDELKQKLAAPPPAAPAKSP